MIRVENLRKSYRTKLKAPGMRGSIESLFRPEYREIDAVHDISFTVTPGTRLGFIGPNGAGKSTTIKMMTGILFPTSGVIDCLGMNPQRDRKTLAYPVGSVFGQKPQLWYHLPPMDTYNLFAQIYELKRTDFTSRLDYLVEQFQIGDLLRVPVRKMSLGQRMRCEITAALLHRPKIIFLDEPTIGLDVVAKTQIRDVIRKLNEEEGVTIFLTSHDAGDIESLAERTIVINHGRLVFDDSTAKFKQNYIKRKVVEFTSDDTLERFEFPGTWCTEKTKHYVKVELDLDAGSIEALLGYAVQNFTLTDVNIYEPPMEEIISAIYQEQTIH